VEALLPLAEGRDEAPSRFADRALLSLLPLGLLAVRLPEAAEAVRALPGLGDTESARRCMFGLEKIARAHAAPEPLIRAVHGVCACALSLGLSEKRPEAAERAETQLVSALVRACTASVKSGVCVEAVVGCLAGEATEGGAAAPPLA
jgi:hypothetical protein